LSDLDSQVVLKAHSEYFFAAVRKLLFKSAILRNIFFGTIPLRTKCDDKQGNCIDKWLKLRFQEKENLPRIPKNVSTFASKVLTPINK